jgi:hypothetical protein
MEENSGSPRPGGATNKAAAVGLLAMAASLAGGPVRPERVIRIGRHTGHPEPEPEGGGRKYEEGSRVSLAGSEYVAGPGGNLVRATPKPGGKRDRKKNKRLHAARTERRLQVELETKEIAAGDQADEAAELAEVGAQLAEGAEGGGGGPAGEDGRAGSAPLEEDPRPAEEAPEPGPPPAGGEADDHVVGAREAEEAEGSPEAEGLGR